MSIFKYLWLRFTRGRCPICCGVDTADYENLGIWRCHSCGATGWIRYIY